MSSVSPGVVVPDFSASATGEKTVQLAQLRGNAVVLYFYPKDSTPGCTQESQDFRDLQGEFAALGAIILGISRDSLKSHENFRSKQALPFDLLSDPDESLCKLFDVIRMKNMYGKQVRGIERSTFLIDANGILVREWRKLSVKGHAQAVLEALRECSLPAT